MGNNATLILDRGGWEVIEEKKSKIKFLNLLLENLIMVLKQNKLVNS